MGLNLPGLDSTNSTLLLLGAGSADQSGIVADAGTLQIVGSDGSTLTTVQAADGVAGSDLVTVDQLAAATSSASVRAITVPYTTSVVSSTAQIPAGARVLRVTVVQATAGTGPITVGTAADADAFLASSDPAANAVTFSPQISATLSAAAAVQVTPSGSGAGRVVVEYATAAA
jgi:hypothetical protein